MKADVIREIVYSTFEARNGVTLKRYEHIADDEVRALTCNVRILEQAGFVVLPKEELEAALKGMLNHSCVADSAPNDKDAEDHEAERRTAALLAAITQEGRG